MLGKSDSKENIYLGSTEWRSSSEKEIIQIQTTHPEWWENARTTNQTLNRLGEGEKPMHFNLG